jgi:hypothetical protein
MKNLVKAVALAVALGSASVASAQTFRFEFNSRANRYEWQYTNRPARQADLNRAWAELIADLDRGNVRRHRAEINQDIERIRSIERALISRR